MQPQASAECQSPAENADDFALVHHLIGLTAVRDQDALMAALGRVLEGVFQSLIVNIHVPVGNPSDRRWLTSFQGGQGMADACAAGEHDLLPGMDAHPERCRALAGQRVLTQVDDLHVALFPIPSPQGVIGVLEVHTLSVLGSVRIAGITTALDVFANLHGLIDYGQRDTLTGLLNRKTFEAGFFKARASAVEPQSLVPVNRRSADGTPGQWVGMIDIDFFKSVNDRYGHLIGDEVLLLVAQLLRKCCRAHDLVYRFGGEEFVVLLQCSNAADAKSVFERLRRIIESHVFPQVGKVTVSIGFTALSVLDSPTAALGRADQAVYYAKANGRNQVRGHEELAADGKLGEGEAAGEVELF